MVEDHKALRQLTVNVLTDSQRFVVVGQATNGEEALRLAVEARPDLILLDLKMPRRDGFSVLPELRQALPHSRIVAYSMLPRERHETQVRALGAELFLDKNIESSELVQRLIALFEDPSAADRPGPWRRGPQEGSLGLNPAFDWPFRWALERSRNQTRRWRPLPQPLLA